MTPYADSPDSADRLPRPSGLTIAVGVLSVLVAGAAVAVAGFIAAGGVEVAPAPATEAGGTGTHSGQLGTLPLHDEKPMKGIGKGVATP